MGFRNNLLKRGIISSDTEVLINARVFKLQLAYANMFAAATITVADLLNGIILGNHTAGATQAYTLPLGADLDAALTSFMINGAAFSFTIVNLSAALVDTITLTANTGITIIGQATIDSAHADSEFPSSGTFGCVKESAGIFVACRL